MIDANLFRAIQLIGGEQLHQAVETIRQTLDEAESRGYDKGFDDGWDIGYEAKSEADAAYAALEVEAATE